MYFYFNGIQREVLQFLKEKNVSDREIYHQMQNVYDTTRIYAELYSDGVRIFVVEEAVQTTGHDLVKCMWSSSNMKIPASLEYRSA